jgi:hypothetical protein
MLESKTLTLVFKIEIVETMAMLTQKACEQTFAQLTLHLLPVPHCLVRLVHSQRDTVANRYRWVIATVKLVMAITVG